MFTEKNQPVKAKKSWNRNWSWLLEQSSNLVSVFREASIIFKIIFLFNKAG
jgi:hypothetical protein